MDTLIERCAGLDIGKADVKACVRVPGGRGHRQQDIRTFATTTNALLELRDWLVECGVTLVGMEATGDYWKPVFYLLEDLLGASTRSRGGFEFQGRVETSNQCQGALAGGARTGANRTPVGYKNSIGQRNRVGDRAETSIYSQRTLAVRSEGP